MTHITLQLLAALLLLIAPTAVLYKTDGRLFKQHLTVTVRCVAALFVLVAVCCWVFSLQLWWADLLLLIVVEGAAAVLWCRKRWLTLPVLLATLPMTFIVALLVLLAVGRSPFDNDWLWVPMVALLHVEALRASRSALLTYVYNRKVYASMYEYLQGNGASPVESMRPFVMRALTKALAPLFASMRDTGLVGVPLLLSALLLSGMQPLEAGVCAAAVTIGIVCCSVLSALLSVAVYEWMQRVGNR